MCVKRGRWRIRKHQRLIEWTTEQRAEECEALYVIGIHAQGMREHTHTHTNSASILIRTGPTLFHFHILVSEDNTVRSCRGGKIKTRGNLLCRSAFFDYLHLYYSDFGLFTPFTPHL